MDALREGERVTLTERVSVPEPEGEPVGVALGLRVPVAHALCDAAALKE